MFQIFSKKEEALDRYHLINPALFYEYPLGHISAFAMKCFGFTFAFHCLPSLHTGSILNLPLLLPYLAFYFRKRLIHFHYTTSVLPGSEKYISGNSTQTESTGLNTIEKWVKSNTYSAKFWCGYNIFELITDKATELMHQGVLVPVRVLGSSICQMLEFSTAHQ